MRRKIPGGKADTSGHSAPEMYRTCCGPWHARLISKNTLRAAHTDVHTSCAHVFHLSAFPAIILHSPTFLNIDYLVIVLYVSELSLFRKCYQD